MKPLFTRLLLAVAILGITGTGVALAVQGSGGTVSPTSSEYDLKAGGVASGKIQIINDGTLPNDYLFSTTDVAFKNENYEQVYSISSNPQSVSNWVTFNVRSIHLEPNQQADVGYTVKVPFNASAGTHYGLLTVSTKPATPESSGVSSVKRLGVGLYVTVDGALTKEGNIISFKSAPWQIGSPLEANLRMSNTGNTLYRPDVQFRVTDLFGNIKFQQDTNPAIFPETTRLIQMKWDKVPQFGLFKVGGTVHYLDRTEKLPSHYVLVMSQKYLLLVSLAIIILLTIALWGKRKHRGPRR